MWCLSWKTFSVATKWPTFTWSPWACLPIMMDFFQLLTILGMFLHTIASLKTVPPNMFLMVPLGDFHIFLSLNSFLKKSFNQMHCTKYSPPLLGVNTNNTNSWGPNLTFNSFLIRSYCCTLYANIIFFYGIGTVDSDYVTLQNTD